MTAAERSASCFVYAAASHGVRPSSSALLGYRTRGIPCCLTRKIGPQPSMRLGCTRSGSRPATQTTPYGEDGGRQGRPMGKACFMHVQACTAQCITCAVSMLKAHPLCALREGALHAVSSHAEGKSGDYRHILYADYIICRIHPADVAWGRRSIALKTGWGLAAGRTSWRLSAPSALPTARGGHGASSSWSVAASKRLAGEPLGSATAAHK